MDPLLIEMEEVGEQRCWRTKNYRIDVIQKKGYDNTQIPFSEERERRILTHQARVQKELARQKKKGN